jgi:radical SAM protein with 4Fe4S-binding SPASM domain
MMPRRFYHDSPFLSIQVILVDRLVEQRLPTWSIAHQCDCDCDCGDCACLLHPCAPDPANFHFSVPLLYVLELTPRCNNKCLGCGNVFNPWVGQPTLDATGWRQVLDIITPSATHLKISGGEPTLHPEFAVIVRDIAARGVPFTLFTNGRWPDPQSLLSLFRAAPTCSGLLVSLHGATAEAHEAFSGVAGSFAQTVANIRQATAAGLPVAMSTVLTRHNHGQIDGMLALAQECGADHVVFNRYLGANRPAIEPTGSQLAEMVALIGQRQRQGAHVKLGNCVPQCFAPGNPSSGCLAGIAYCAIDPQGNLRPCAHDGLTCGNILQQPIEEIWNGPAMEAWRNYIPQDCRTCAALAACNTGCRATARLRGGHDPLMCVPLQDLPQPEVVKLEMYENARPLGQFALRVEPFGHVLVRGSQIVSLSPEDEHVLAACDGTTTLRQIEQRFGEEALQLVGILCQKGVIDLLY